MNAPSRKSRQGSRKSRKGSRKSRQNAKSRRQNATAVMRKQRRSVNGTRRRRANRQH